ncbi:hypothetical protein D1007_32403 [Hordeum vulgare]|nr:hypothetical protein D1007_32403 [Hordeum vulgare]
MAEVGVAPIGTRLASREVRPRRVSAKRSWPPGCGRFPAAPSAPGGDGAKGVIEDMVGVGVTPIGARLASRGVRPRRVSAKRSWPPGCGRFPAATSAPGGHGVKGTMIEDRVEEATASQPETEGTVDVRKEGGEARPSGVGDALALAERESQCCPEEHYQLFRGDSWGRDNADGG